MFKRKKSNKVLLQDWDAYISNLKRETPVSFFEDPAMKQKRIAALLNDFEAFCKYYFPNYASAQFAPFHLEFADKVTKNDRIYIVRAWAREHAKSVIAGLFLPLFLKFNKEATNMLLVSNNYEKAEELITPIMLNLEHNARLVHDFGSQKGFKWEAGHFVTCDGCSFRALGAGQSPRGSRNEEKRPDFVLIDDIDTDDESRNQARINRKFEWIEQALFPAMSVSGKKRFIVVGNIISKESCVVKASKIADDFKTINITDKNGKPSWSRYSDDDVKYMLSKMSYASAQKEYFNNPITEGTVFREMHFGKVPTLGKFKYLICYTDPSFKDHKKADFKATVLVGQLEGRFYVIKAFVEQTTTQKMIDWHVQIEKEFGEKVPIYYYIESNFLQDTFLDEFRKRAPQISIKGDDRKKAEKYTRIESTLQPLNDSGRLILNESEQKDKGMQTLVEQFKCVEPRLSSGHDDAPDAVEGAVFLTKKKMIALTDADIDVVSFTRSLKKY